MKDRRHLWCIMLIVTEFLCFIEHRGYGSGIPTYELILKSPPCGGSLVLARTLNRNVNFVSVVTTVKDSPETVVRKLADAINTWNSLSPMDAEFSAQHRLWEGGFNAKACGASLTLPGLSHTYILAGSESGLGIPKAPSSLSCSFDEEKDEVVLNWINPADGYDFIICKCYWTDFDNWHTQRIIGTSTRLVIDRQKLRANIHDMDFRVIGFRENVPSNAAAIHVSGYGHCQEETYGIPFARGVAPNWTAWSTAAKIDKAAFQQGQKYANFRVASPATALSTKPFYQVIKAPVKGAVHGVYRKFLGLIPGHTYRITACVSTLAMDSIMANWSFSLHAAPSAAGTDLTVQQLAGMAGLPYGKSGPPAGRIASYSQGNTTKGTHQIVLSHDKVAGGPESTHITLPPGVDTITVWARFSCSDPKGQVGFAGVELEDITANPKVKSADQIMSEEVSAEAELLRRKQRALREESP